MLKFYYNPAYKYTNRTIINVSGDSNYREIDYQNIDSPDTINGHIIYTLAEGENVPSYVVDTDTNRRYFVSGITQLRTGKFQISLLRDIISENPDTWKQEQAYITAGTAINYNRYKRWNLPFTNTKIKQEKLTINGKSSFFVFYVNEQHINNNLLTEDDLHIASSTVPGITGYDYTVSDLSDIPNSNLVGAGDLSHWYHHKTTVSTIMQLPPSQGGYVWPPEETNWTYDSDPSDPQQPNLTYLVSSPPFTGHIKVDAYYNRVENNINNSKTDFQTAIENFVSAKEASYGNSIAYTQVTSLAPYLDKVILDTSTNKVWTIRGSIVHSSENVYTTSSTLQSAMRNINWPGPTPSADHCTATGDWICFMSERNVYTYTWEELGTATTFDFTFKANIRKLPKSAVRCVNIVSDSTHSDEEITQCLMLAQTNGINPDNTTGRILDIQYLPFSIAESTNSNIKINNTPAVAQFLEFDDYQYSIDLTDLTNINKETDTIKIVSPSRATQFLFRPYDNDGNMEFGVRVTLRPYTSAIYIRPSTRGLLVYDWDDKDCMIIQEDFSLTNVTSEWTQYIYNNRTYLNAFERQMQGREYERTWERRVEQAQAKSDEWNARNISAQKAQTYTGNIPIISGMAAAVGTAYLDEQYMKAAQLDREYNEALYQEGMSLSRDLFEYQLENIKSQPQIPSKVTTIDCKFLDGVYLEYYSTNETELAAIVNFYKYNGNRIDDYGTFALYWGGFVRGKIIISANYTQPEVDELNRRLSMGIFTGGML